MNRHWKGTIKIIENIQILKESYPVVMKQKNKEYLFQKKNFSNDRKEAKKAYMQLE